MPINEDLVRRFVQEVMQTFINVERDLVTDLPTTDQVETALAIRGTAKILWDRMAQLIVDRMGAEAAAPILAAAQRLADEAVIRARPNAQA